MIGTGDGAADISGAVQAPKFLGLQAWDLAALTGPFVLGLGLPWGTQPETGCGSGWIPLGGAWGSGGGSPFGPIASGLSGALAASGADRRELGMTGQCVHRRQMASTKTTVNPRGRGRPDVRRPFLKDGRRSACNLAHGRRLPRQPSPQGRSRKSYSVFPWFVRRVLEDSHDLGIAGIS